LAKGVVDGFRAKRLVEHPVVHQAIAQVRTLVRLLEEAEREEDLLLRGGRGQRAGAVHAAVPVVEDVASTRLEGDAGQVAERAQARGVVEAHRGAVVVALREGVAAVTQAVPRVDAAEENQTLRRAVLAGGTVVAAIVAGVARQAARATGV